MSKRDYLNIPYEEHIVPFPNFGSVIMQHAREFPDKTAIHTTENAITYSQLLQYCTTIDLNDSQNDLISLLAKLFKGIPIELSFKDPLDIRTNIPINELDDIDYFEPPYVRLDDKALVLNNKYEFTQYNILVAAQAVGNAFKLFREGAAYSPPQLLTISDLLFGVLGPLYFGKSIYFYEVDEPNFFQYAWKGTFESNLRDTAMVTDDHDEKTVFRLESSYELAFGLGEMISPEGKDVTFLGFEIENGEPKGHCLGKVVSG